MSVKEDKLLALLDALEEMLDQGNDNVWLDDATVEQLAGMKRFVQAWLEDASTQTETAWAEGLAKLTANLRPKILTRDDTKITLH